MKFLKSSRILKILIGLCIFMSLFFSYQLPFGYVQTTFKLIFLGLAALLSFVLLGFKSESGKRIYTLILIAFIALTAFLYLFETE
jgi:uncharacterized membrane protein